MTEESFPYSVTCYVSKEPTQENRQIAIEEPLEIQIAQRVKDQPLARSFSITMRTPGNDIALGLGFLYSEGIIQSLDDVNCIDHCGKPSGSHGERNTLRIDLNKSVSFDFETLQRAFLINSSCGVCGKSAIDAMRSRKTRNKIPHSLRFRRQQLQSLPQALDLKQQQFTRTGGTHAAALLCSNASIIEVHEDVGRHNALDKLIGSQLIKENLQLHDCGLLLSGRISYELVQKALISGIQLLVAFGAPSSLAIDMAAEFGITLIGFLRPDGFTVYSESSRIID